jgi:hypothetical protein
MEEETKMDSKGSVLNASNLQEPAPKRSKITAKGKEPQKPSAALKRKRAKN